VTEMTTLERVYVMSTVLDTVETFDAQGKENEEEALVELLEIVQKLSEIPEA
jgi:hypothetical protein